MAFPLRLVSSIIIIRFTDLTVVLQDRMGWAQVFLTERSRDMRTRVAYAKYTGKDTTSVSSPFIRKHTRDVTLVVQDFLDAWSLGFAVSRNILMVHSECWLTFL